MVGRKAILLLTFGVIADDQLHRVEHGDAAFGDFIQVFSHAVFEHRIINPRIGFGDADALCEAAETFRRITAAARTDEGGQTWIIPAGDVFFVDQLDQLAFGQHDISQVEPREFDLLR